MGKIRTYFDLKNRISNSFLVLPSYLLFYIGLILRFTQKDPENFASARSASRWFEFVEHFIFYSYRIVMAVDLELWYIRSIVLVGISSHLGPKIVMIRKMVCSSHLYNHVLLHDHCRLMIFRYSLSSLWFLFSAMELHQDLWWPMATSISTADNFCMMSSIQFIISFTAALIMSARHWKVRILFEK